MPMNRNSVVSDNPAVSSGKAAPTIA